MERERERERQKKKARHAGHPCAPKKKPTGLSEKRTRRGNDSPSCCTLRTCTYRTGRAPKVIDVLVTLASSAVLSHDKQKF